MGLIMTHFRLFLFLFLLLPQYGFANYNVDEIKTNILKNSTVFKVSDWVKDSNKPLWKAKTALKRVKIKVSDKKSEIISPFIGRKQTRNAKQLCTEFASIVLGTNEEEERKKIKLAIKKSTTRHHVRYFTTRNLRFSVAPILVGGLVSLHCIVEKQ